MDSRSNVNSLRYCPTCRHVVAGTINDTINDPINDPINDTINDTIKSATCFPFCSERCQLFDLSRWLNEDYRIPGKDYEQ